jgi:hypothetical protein
MNPDPEALARAPTLDLPAYPAMSAPGYVVLALGVLLLLLAVILAGKHRFVLLAAFGLLAYYPLAYLLHWFLFNFDRPARVTRETPGWVAFLERHLTVFDGLLMAGCGLFAALSLAVWALLLRKRKRRVRGEAATPFDELEAAVVVPGPAGRRRAAAKEVEPEAPAPPAKPGAKRPAPREKNPFDLS